MRAARLLPPHDTFFSMPYEAAERMDAAGEGGGGRHLAEFSVAGVTENPLACV